MSKASKKRGTSNNKNENGAFHSKHVKHDPQAESARAVSMQNDIGADKKG